MKLFFPGNKMLYLQTTGPSLLCWLRWRSKWGFLLQMWWVGPYRFGMFSLVISVIYLSSKVELNGHKLEIIFSDNSNIWRGQNQLGHTGLVYCHNPNGQFLDQYFNLWSLDPLKIKLWRKHMQITNMCTQKDPFLKDLANTIGINLLGRF